MGKIEESVWRELESRLGGWREPEELPGEERLGSRSNKGV